MALKTKGDEVSDEFQYMKNVPPMDTSFNLRSRSVVAADLRLLAFDSVLHIINTEQSQESIQQYRLSANAR